MTETTDPRPQLHAAFDQASRVVAGVAPGQLRGPTPCTEFDVATLAAHMVGVARRIASVGRGAPQEGAVDVSGIADDGLGKAFDEARQAAFAAWEDDGILAKELVLPFATLPGVMVARVYALELTVHSWDLAVATGQVASLDPALADAVLPVAMQMLPPEPRGGEMPFDPVIAVPETAPSYDRLAGYMGRRPM